MSTKQIPMNHVAIIIVKKTGVGNDSVTHYATLAIGNVILRLLPNEEEVFRCSAAGKNILACIETVRRRVLEWAKAYHIEHIVGLGGNEEPCSLIIDTGGGNDITVFPVYYNDWICESPYARE